MRIYVHVCRLSLEILKNSFLVTCLKQLMFIADFLDLRRESVPYFSSYKTRELFDYLLFRRRKVDPVDPICC